MLVQWGDFIWVVGDKVHVETKKATKSYVPKSSQRISCVPVCQPQDNPGLSGQVNESVKNATTTLHDGSRGSRLYGMCGVRGLFLHRERTLHDKRVLQMWVLLRIVGCRVVVVYYETGEWVEEQTREPRTLTPGEVQKGLRLVGECELIRHVAIP